MELLNAVARRTFALALALLCLLEVTMAAQSLGPIDWDFGLDYHSPITNLSCGDTISFEWDTSHNMFLSQEAACPYQFPKSSGYAPSNGVYYELLANSSDNANVSYTFTSGGAWYFQCGEMPHCARGNMSQLVNVTDCPSNKGSAYPPTMPGPFPAPVAIAPAPSAGASYFISWKIGGNYTVAINAKCGETVRLYWGKPLSTHGVAITSNGTCPTHYPTTSGADEFGTYYDMLLYSEDSGIVDYTFSKNGTWYIQCPAVPHCDPVKVGGGGMNQKVIVSGCGAAGAPAPAMVS